MIFSCTNSLKEESKVSEIKQPSGAGMPEEEIKNMQLEELVNLKNSISNYLKCSKLKNRNIEFLVLYTKINKEINTRNNSVGLVKKQIFETKVERNLTTSKNFSCLSSKLDSSSIVNEEQNIKKPSTFLKRKFSFSESLLDLVFPSFLNDKSNQIPIEKQLEENSQVSSEYFEDEKPCKKSNVKKTKRCLKDFNQGLFNQKIDVNNDDFIGDFYAPSLVKSKMEDEIKNTLFNEVPEDLFFELD